MSSVRFPTKGRVLVKILRPIARMLYRLSYEGSENIPTETGFLFVGNHVSSFDAVPLMDLSEKHGFIPHTLAKYTLWKVPVIRHLMDFMNTIPVYRGTGRAREAMEIAQDRIGAGAVVAMFPEGTTTRQEHYWPMTGKTGAARIALQTKCQVIPFAQWGTHRVLPRYSVVPRIFFFHKVRYLIGPPIDLSDLYERAEDFEAAREATRRIMATITHLLEELRSQSAPPVPYDIRVDGDPFRSVPSMQLAKADRRMIRTQLRSRRRTMRQLLTRGFKGSSPSVYSGPRREVSLLISDQDKGKLLAKAPELAQIFRNEGIEVRLRVTSLDENLSQVVRSFGSSRVIAGYGNQDFLSHIEKEIAGTDRLLIPIDSATRYRKKDEFGIPQAISDLNASLAVSHSQAENDRPSAAD